MPAGIVKIYGKYIDEKYGDFELTDEQRHELAYAIQKRLTKEEIAFVLRTKKGEKKPAFSGWQMREMIIGIQCNIPLDTLEKHCTLKFSKDAFSNRLSFIRRGIQYHFTEKQLNIIKNLDITGLTDIDVLEIYDCVMNRLPVEKILGSLIKSNNNILYALSKFKGEQIPKSEYDTEMIQYSSKDITNIMKKYKDAPQYRRQEIKAALSDGIKSETIDSYYRDYPDAPLQFKTLNGFTVKNEYYPMISKKARDILLPNTYNEYQAQAVIDACNLPYTDEELKVIVNPKYNCRQMSTIAEGFLKGITIEQSKIYLDEYTGENVLVYSPDQIDVLQKAVLPNLSKKHLELLANPDYPSFKMDAIMSAILYRFDEQKVNLLRKVKCSEDDDKDYISDVMECMKKGVSVDELEFVKMGEEKFELPFGGNCMKPEKKYSLLETHTRHGRFERETCTFNDKNKFMEMYNKREQSILTKIGVAMGRGVKTSDIKKYMDQADGSNLSASQTSQIIGMLIDNVPEKCIERTITGEYNVAQMRALKDIYKLELTEEQLKFITNNMYDENLMKRIANAFLCGITVEEILPYIESIYKTPSAANKLDTITQAILRKEHPELLAKLATAGFDSFQIDQIETCYRYRLTEDEITIVANKDFDEMKIAYLREMMLDGYYEIAELLENSDQKHSDIIEIMYDANLSYEAIMKGLGCAKARDDCNTDISDGDLIDLICRSRDLEWTRTCIENKFGVEQIHILLKAEKRGFSKNQLKTIANKNLTAEQMSFLVDHIYPEKNKSDKKVKEWDTVVGSITITEHRKPDTDVR